MLANFSVEQSLMKAKSHAKKGELAEAQKLYETILQNFSNNIRAQQGLAASIKNNQNNVIQSPPQEVVSQLVNLYNQGQFVVVAEQAEVLTKQFPVDPVIWNILGASRSKIGMFDEAIDAYKKSISIEPNDCNTYFNMGIVLNDKGNLVESIEAYKKAISLKPNYAEAYSNMGVILKDQDKLDEAIDAYKKAITFKPDYAEAYDNMGVALKNQGKLEEAIEVYKKAILLKPSHVKSHYNMGNALREQLKLDEAIEYYSKSISLDPNYIDAYNNLGLTLYFQDKFEEAMQAYNKAISINSECPDTRKNLSYVLLRSYRLKEGLDEMEWRWKTQKFLSQQRHFLQPIWDGRQSLNDKRILIWCEQGIGDTLNWSSCLPLLSSRSKHVILECQEKLIPLLTRSFPDVEIKAEDRSRDKERDDFDVHLPIGSLYRHFIDDITQNPKPDAYLIPDPERVKFWKERLNSIGKGPYIGISWKSSIMSPERLPNYSSISEWSEILSIPDVHFINLQSKDYTDDLAKVREGLGVTVHNFDDLDQFNDIDDVAALCTAIDMVVSNKTTVPLISVGVGTATKLANWRQSPWNNILNNPVGSSVEIFERDTLEPWDNVFKSIAEDILTLNKDWSI